MTECGDIFHDCYTKVEVEGIKQVIKLNDKLKTQNFEILSHSSRSLSSTLRVVTLLWRTLGAFGNFGQLKLSQLSSNPAWFFSSPMVFKLVLKTFFKKRQTLDFRKKPPLFSTKRPKTILIQTFWVANSIVMNFGVATLGSLCVPALGILYPARSKNYTLFSKNSFFSEESILKGRP